MRRRPRAVPAGAARAGACAGAITGGRPVARAAARRQALRCLAVGGALAALATLGAAPAGAAQPPGDAAANLAGSGRLDAALALLDTWLADHPDDPRMFPLLLQVVTAAPLRSTVEAVVERYRSGLAGDQVAVLRAAPADLAELSGGVEQALQALELPGVRAAAERRAALLLELGEVTPDTAPAGMPAVHAGLVRSGEGLGEAGLEPALRAAFDSSGAPGGGAAAVAGYGLVSLLAANGRAAEAAKVLEELRRRYPRSPEYALAAAELNAGAAPPPRVVAFPSPAMLLGSLAAACLPPCPPPAARLLAREAERAPAPPTPAPLADVERAATLLAASTAEPPATPEAAPEPLVVAEPLVAPEPLVAVEPPPRAAPEPAAAPAAEAPRAEAAPAAFVTAPEAASPAVLVPLPEPEPPPFAAEQPPVRPALVMPRPELEPPAFAAARPSAAPPGAPDEPPAAAAAPADAARDPLVRVSSQPARPARPATAAAEGAVDTISGRVLALLGSSARSRPPAVPAVRAVARPDPAAFIVQTGAYRDPDHVLELEQRLAQAGFAALARSYRVAGGGIIHRVTVGGNMTRAQAEQLLASLSEAGHEGIIVRRDDASYLPPAPPTR